MNRKNVTVYTDGACKGNPGPGGYGVLLMCDGVQKELSGGEPETTNNRMELLGVITALSCLKYPCDVSLYTDSQYVCNGINKGWAKKWQSNGWMRTKTEPAKNKELWEQLLALIGQHSVRFYWVKGHADNPYNNRCDELAVAEAQKFFK